MLSPTKVYGKNCYNLEVVSRLAKTVEDKYGLENIRKGVHIVPVVEDSHWWLFLAIPKQKAFVIIDPLNMQHQKAFHAFNAYFRILLSTKPKKTKHRSVKKTRISIGTPKYTHNVSMTDDWKCLHRNVDQKSYQRDASTCAGYICGFALTLSFEAGIGRVDETMRGMVVEEKEFHSIWADHLPEQIRLNVINFLLEASDTE